MAAELQCWDVTPEATLADITYWCVSNRGVDRLLVVARPDNRWPGQLSEPRVERAVQTVFFGKILRTVWASAWPGTMLLRNRFAKVWLVAFDETVRERMVATENTLSGWVHAAHVPLPEDICLYRAGDPLPTFVSVTHEPEAWLFDQDANAARFALRADRPLSSKMIPPPPTFLLET